MDQLIKKTVGDLAITSPLDVTTLAISMALSFVLTFFLAKVYIRTHHGYSYSKSFVHTIVFVAITINLIMLIIGSNIARAFALVGAMSIVRFRNPIKDTRDLIFLFMAMAIGMATGTQFYVFAIVFTVFAILILLAFEYFDFGEAPSVALVLKVRTPPDLMARIETACGEHCRNVSVIAIDQSGDERERQDVVFEIELHAKASHQALLEALTAISPDISVNVLVGESSVSV